MLLLGVLAAQAEAAAPAGPPAYDLLETEILTGSQASVTFSSLNSTYGADYQHLQLRTTARTTRAASGMDQVITQFNGDTGNNYAVHRLNGTGSSVTSNAYVSRPDVWFGLAPRDSLTAGFFGASVVDILDPFDTNKNTTVRVLAGGETVVLYSGLWNNTAALTSILLKPESNDWKAGSRFSLYGLRSA